MRTSSWPGKQAAAGHVVCRHMLAAGLARAAVCLGEGTRAPGSNSRCCRASLCSPTGTSPTSEVAATPCWRRGRHWFAPAPHRLLPRHVGNSQGSVSRFACPLLHAHHAYLWQHQVGGRPLLPGAAMFEAAYAAASAVLAEGHQPRLSLQAAAIVGPLLLQSRGSSASDPSLLSLAVDRRTGQVQLGSGAGRHLQANAACGAAVEGAAPRQPAATTLTPALLLSLSSQQPAASWRGEAVGSLCCVPLLPGTDSFHCHPAEVDAATHLGAAFDLAGSRGAPCVPVALGSYSARSAEAPGHDSRAAPRFASAAACSLGAYGSRTSSFAVPGSLALCQLRSQPLGTRQQQQRQATAAAAGSSLLHEALARDCYSYHTVWQAAAALPHWAGSPKARPPLLLLQGSCGQSSVPAPASILQAALRSYAATLRMLHALRPGSVQQLAGTTYAAASQQGPPLAAPSSGSRALAAAGATAVAGILKVAAAEEPTWKLQLVHADAFATRPSGIPASDAFGAAAAAGMVMQPAMQLAAAQPGVPASAVSTGWRPAPPCCHVISGGLGGLGALAACHLAQQAQREGRMLLLGRSGRFAAGANGQLELLRSGPGSVAVLQANAAAAEDAAAAAACPQLSGSPAVSFVHTAGVLADGLLPGQTLALARVVCAPKLGGLSAAAPHLQRRPLQQMLLFSSVSAALGNRGQANYAAANAALDASASVLAACGQHACSMQWGAWAGTGMASASPQLLARLEKAGGPQGRMRNGPQRMRGSTADGTFNN